MPFTCASRVARLRRNGQVRPVIAIQVRDRIQGGPFQRAFQNATSGSGILEHHGSDDDRVETLEQAADSHGSRLDEEFPLLGAVTKAVPHPSSREG
jgi:hypothetical protein